MFLFKEIIWLCLIFAAPGIFSLLCGMLDFSCGMQTLNCSMWDLCSLSRDRTHVPCIARQNLNQWATKEVPTLITFAAVTSTPRWPVAYQAAWFMGFSRQEYWSRLPFPSPGDLPDPGIESGSPTL